MSDTAEEFIAFGLTEVTLPHIAIKIDVLYSQE